MATQEQKELAASVMSSSAVEGYLGGDVLEARIFADNLEEWLNRRADEACGEEFSAVINDVAGEDEGTFFNEVSGDTESNGGSADSKTIFRRNGYQPRFLLNSDIEHEPQAVQNSQGEDFK